MSGYYFEDFHKGQIVELSGVTITESQIIDFALQFDPQPLHLDRVVASQSPLNGLIASGFHSLALSFRLFVDQGLLRTCSVGGAGLNEVRWIKPLRPGDTMRGRVTVMDTRLLPTSTDRGICRFLFEMVNQSDEPVLSYIGTIVLLRRPRKGDGAP